ncbi:MAG: PAS domain S-box protein [Sphingomonadaceae bacterium]|nr:PAS domain S-box protein [Sphingomonadaceae bacterium]
MDARPQSGPRLIDDALIAGLLAEASDFAVFELDCDGICTAWEPLSANYQRFSPNEIIGKCLEAFYPQEQRQMYWRDLEKAASRGRAEGEGWRLRKDGTRSWMRFILLRRDGKDGEHIGFAGVVFDATRQHESDQALYASEEIHRALLSGLKDHAVGILDPDGYVLRWSKDTPKMLGRSESEMEGAHLSEFFATKERAVGAAKEMLRIAREEGHFEMESWKLRRDGSRFRADITAVPLHSDEDGFFGYGIIVRDVTERYESAGELAAAREALGQSEKLRALGELTGGIAHDFNNLLTVIRGSAELLARDGLPADKRNKHVAAIIETADRAAELTGQLLSYARRQPLQPKMIRLNDSIADMSELLKRSLGNGVSILATPDPALWEVRADPTQLQNLVLNAAINSRDAMNGRGTLTITTRNIAGPSGDEVRLSISDTGTGMNKEVMERAFEPFFTTKAPGEGTGLGLSQAYGFAAQSGGRLELASEAGRGTTLSLFLPRAIVVEEHDAAERSCDTKVPRGTRILLVEDSRTVAAFAQALLEEMGCEVVYAINAEDALLVLEDDPREFDIIFSDIVMPGLSGLDLAAKIRAQRPSQPILLATGYSEAAARGVGSEFPILPKPYRRDNLSEMLGKTIGEFGRAA